MFFCRVSFLFPGKWLHKIIDFPYTWNWEFSSSSLFCALLCLFIYFYDCMMEKHVCLLNRTHTQYLDTMISSIYIMYVFICIVNVFLLVVHIYTRSCSRIYMRPARIYVRGTCILYTSCTLYTSRCASIYTRCVRITYEVCVLFTASALQAHTVPAR